MKNKKKNHLLKEEKWGDQMLRLETNMFNSNVHRTTFDVERTLKSTKRKEFRGRWESLSCIYLEKTVF